MILFRNLLLWRSESQPKEIAKKNLKNVVAVIGTRQEATGDLKVRSKTRFGLSAIILTSAFQVAHHARVKYESFKPPLPPIVP
jgi:hypothetical protein